MSRATGGKKTDAKAFALQKRKRRQWLTFMRMCRYGVNNFSRNAWLTVAATAMMTLTLFVIMVAVMARNVLTDSVAEIRDKVNMSIYVQTDTSENDIAKIKTGLEGLSSVRRVTFVSPSEARKDYAEQNRNDAKTLDALNNATNKLPGIFHVNVEDINNTTELEQFVKSDTTVKSNVDPDRPPSFESSRRDAIKTIGKWVSFADKLGITSSIILVIISSLIVFNTIRMAIFNRKDEIQMMKLIGADKGFIRGPFIVEAVVYGFIAAVIATGLGVLSLFGVREKLESYGISVTHTVEIVTVYAGFVLLAMIVVGAIIGVISSLFATRKYLKI